MTSANPLSDLESLEVDELPPDIAGLSDRQLVASVVQVLTEPPTDPADSFVLHAPLELMARAELLPDVEPEARDRARRRILGIAVDWRSRRPHAPLPVATVPGDGPADLGAAIAGGDLDGVDLAVAQLAALRTVDEFVALAVDSLLGHLGGAGHLSIFLDQISRATRPPSLVLATSRALLRDLARHPDWTIRWIDERPHDAALPSTTTFVDVLAGTPSAGDPGSNFIYPTMHLVDRTGLAAELLTGPTASTSVLDARRQLLRVAAMSMLQDDAAHAPYGWSHCLTMPQATLALAPRSADPSRAIAIAATYVLGFRATLSHTAIDLDWQPDRPVTQRSVLDGDLDDAVAQAWHTDRPDLLERELATHAACHHDAHLAKYTLACFHAAHDDPGAAPLYRAAAARLAVWWRDHDDAG